MAGKRLGKGLRSIVGETGTSEVVMLDVESIEPNEFQPRRELKEEELQSLAESVKRDGLLQPVMVRREGKKFRLVFGERRWRAALAAGLKTIPAVIKDVTEEECFRLALIENLQRVDLNPIEKARAIRSYIETFSLTQKDVGERLGMARSSVANFLRILALPEEVQRMVERGELSFGHARALLAYPESRILAEARRIVRKRLPVRRVERKRVEAKRPAIKALEESLSEKLMRRVRIRERGEGGVVEIEFYSDDDLSALVDTLCST